MHQFISLVLKLRREGGRGAEGKVRYTKNNESTENLFRQIFDFWCTKSGEKLGLGFEPQLTLTWAKSHNALFFNKIKSAFTK